MIKTKDDLRFYLEEDRKRNGISKNRITYWIKYLCGSENAHIFHWIRHYRKWEYHSNQYGFFSKKILGLYHEIKTKRIGLKLGISASINRVGYGLRIMHLAGGGGVLLNASKIGNYCGFNTGVLLGNIDSNENRPVIGNHVAFGPGAKCFGKVEIGDNTFVAPNAVVTKSMPPNSIVGGIPAKVIKLKD